MPAERESWWADGLLRSNSWSKKYNTTRTPFVPHWSWLIDDIRERIWSATDCSQRPRERSHATSSSVYINSTTLVPNAATCMWRVGRSAQPSPDTRWTENRKRNGKASDTDEEYDGVDDAENFEDAIRRAALLRRHRLPIDGRRAVIFVVRHRSPHSASCGQT